LIKAYTEKVSSQKIISSRTLELFKNSRKILKGKDTHSFVAACLHIACREQEIPSSPIIIAELANVKRDKLVDIFNQICKLHKISLPLDKADKKVRYVASKASMPEFFSRKAIKILNQEFSHYPAAIQLLEQECSNTQILKHPNIVTVNDFDRDVTIVDVFEGVGKQSTGKMTKEDLFELERVACPSAGSCGGQFTANTMACVSEAIGLALPGSAGTPAIYETRDKFAVSSGEAVMNLLKKNIRPRDIVTRKSLENAAFLTNFTPHFPDNAEYASALGAMLVAEKRRKK
jgi:hypothetical protein